MMVMTETIALYSAQRFTAFYQFLPPQKSSEAVPIIFSVLNVSKLRCKRSVMPLSLETGSLKR